MKIIRTIVPAGLILAGLIGAGAACSSSSSSAPAVHPSSSSSAPKIACAGLLTAPTKPSAPAKPAAPAITVAQQQAVDAAKSYLDLGSGFSRAGLIDQLTSSAGSGFSVADATFAVNYLHPDFDAQAVLAAKSYMQLGGFSRASLIEQLTSSAGSSFTLAQATYAANSVGL